MMVETLKGDGPRRSIRVAEPAIQSVGTTWRLAVTPRTRRRGTEEREATLWWRG